MEIELKREMKMKLSQLPDRLFRIISREEHDLELLVEIATVSVKLKRGGEIVIHNWEYTSEQSKITQ